MGWEVGWEAGWDKASGFNDCGPDMFDQLWHCDFVNCGFWEIGATQIHYSLVSTCVCVCVQWYGILAEGLLWHCDCCDCGWWWTTNDFEQNSCSLEKWFTTAQLGPSNQVDAILLAGLEVQIVQTEISITTTSTKAWVNHPMEASPASPEPSHACSSGLA